MLNIFIIQNASIKWNKKNKLHFVLSPNWFRCPVRIFFLLEQATKVTIIIIYLLSTDILKALEVLETYMKLIFLILNPLINFSTVCVMFHICFMKSEWYLAFHRAQYSSGCLSSVHFGGQYAVERFFLYSVLALGQVGQLQSSGQLTDQKTAVRILSKSKNLSGNQLPGNQQLTFIDLLGLILFFNQSSTLSNSAVSFPWHLNLWNVYLIFSNSCYLHKWF